MHAPLWGSEYRLDWNQSNVRVKEQHGMPTGFRAVLAGTGRAAGLHSEIMSKLSRKMKMIVVIIMG